MRLTSDENVRLTLNENVGNHRGTKTTFGEVGTLASDCQLIILRGHRDGGGRGTSMPWAHFRRGTNRHVIWIYLLREHGRRSINPALANSPCPLCSLCSTCPLCFSVVCSTGFWSSLMRYWTEESKEYKWLASKFPQWHARRNPDNQRFVKTTTEEFIKAFPDSEVARSKLQSVSTAFISAQVATDLYRKFDNGTITMARRIPISPNVLLIPSSPSKIGAKLFLLNPIKPIRSCTARRTPLLARSWLRIGSFMLLVTKMPSTNTDTSSSDLTTPTCRSSHFSKLYSGTG